MKKYVLFIVLSCIFLHLAMIKADTINLRTQTGQNFFVDVNDGATIADLRKAVLRHEALGRQEESPERITVQIGYGGRILKDDSLLSDAQPGAIDLLKVRAVAYIQRDS